jgi:ubiquinone/menaquinone biosynthesis C-methylase UbiE
MNVYLQSPDHYDSSLSAEYVDQYYGKVKDLVSQHMKSSGTSVLDLCCGTGVVAGLLTDLPGVTYVGIDINQRFLQRAREKTTGCPHFKFIASDAVALAVKNEFEIILLINAYHHFQNHLKSAVLHNASALLSATGVMIVYETAIPKFSTAKEFAAANRAYYLKRIEWVTQQKHVSEDELDAWQNFCKLSVRAEDEYKVDYDYMMKDFDSSGLTAVHTTKTWPAEHLFDDEKVGDFIFALTKKGVP